MDPDSFLGYNNFQISRLIKSNDNQSSQHSIEEFLLSCLFHLCEVVLKDAIKSIFGPDQ